MTRIVVTFTYALLFWGCAKQTNPTGGPKDEDPPQLLRSVPSNRQTNYTRTEIELVFNEFIQLNNPREQIVIVPPVGKKFETIARKNRVTIKFNSQLRDSTTYTINFREAIQDLSEKNPAKNLKLAFSTGDYIDSLSVEGKVHDLLKGLPAENFTVAITPLSDTFSIFKHPAQFFTLTDKSGRFFIENIKAGNYRIYAFQDKNKNLLVDSRSESFAFLSDTLNIRESIKNINLSCIALDMRPIKIISAKPLGNHFLVRVNKGYTTYAFESMMQDYKLQFDHPDFSSIRFYNTIVDHDSIPVRLTFTDSINSKIDTILHVKFNKLSLQKERFTVKTQNLIYLENKRFVSGELVFNKPISSVICDSIYIRLDSVTISSFKNEDFSWNQSFTQALIRKQLLKPLDLTISPKQPKSSTQQQTPRLPGSDARRGQTVTQQTGKPNPAKIFNQLILSPASITSVEGDSINFLSAPFSVIKPESSAVLIIEIQGPGNAITQLVDKNYKLVLESSSKKIRAENLTPGEYFIRTILDINNNGKWDPGNYYLNMEPEKIIFYTDDTGNKSINLKANWEVGPLLIRY